MKRIKAACICQTLHFQLKEDLEHSKRAAHRRPHQNSNLVCFLFNQKVQKAAAPESCQSVLRRRQPSAASCPETLLMCDKEAIEV